MRVVRLAGSAVVFAMGCAAAQAQTTYPRPISSQQAYPQQPYPQQPYATPPPLYPAPSASDADRLASEIRLLAADPRNLQALVRAGELALKLDDDTAAAAFFARAERIDPHNGRAKAGEGSLLVAAERPGEALRRFAEAETLGADVRGFAADRGLAYDLLGEQERAQRDYRLALKAGADEETQRRYALSLGISGKRELALAQIDPLLRKSDRGAWRARAFILAMGGDRAGAEKIATSMMPAGMAQGLQLFFDILPALRPADRAFAVHFGEVRANAGRLADARLAPPLAALGPDPTVPVAVAVAAVAKPPAVADARLASREARRRDRQSRRARTDLAAATTPASPPAAQALPGPPAYAERAVPAPVVLAANTARLPPSGAATSPRATFAVPTRGGAPAVPPSGAVPARAVGAAKAATIVPVAPTRPAPGEALAAPPRVSALPSALAAGSFAALPTTPGSLSSAVVSRPPAVVVSAPVAPRPLAPVAIAPGLTQPVQVAPRPVPDKLASSAFVAPQPVSITPAPPASVAPRSLAAAGSSVVPGSPQPAPITSAAPQSVAVPVPAPAATVAAAPVNAAAAPKPVRSEESILAAIIADIKVPRTELATDDAAPVRREVAAVAPAADRAAADALAAEKAEADRKATLERLATDKRAAAEKKALADRKAAADKKLADAKKVVEAKRAAEEKRKKDPKLLEPSRVWVQVAGGANEGDLAKQWAKLRAKSAKAFGGKAGWTTPLRATNRILTGPFKSEDEAQAFVNSLTREGLSGFVFVSDAGQKIAKLPAK